MRFWLTLLAVSCCLICATLADDSVSDEQMLEMGLERWMPIYHRETGNDSNVAIHEGYCLYAYAAERAADTVDAKRAGDLRELLAKFGTDMLEILENGGRMTAQFGSAQMVESAETGYAVFVHKRPPAKPITTGVVRRKLNRIRRLIDRYHAKGQDVFLGYETGQQALDNLDGDFSQICAFAARLERPGSDYVLQCCMTWLNDMEENIRLNFDEYGIDDMHDMDR